MTEKHCVQNITRSVQNKGSTNTKDFCSIALSFAINILIIQGKKQHRIALPRLGILLIHPLFSFFKEADGLFCLFHQIFHEDPKVFVLSQDLHLSLIAGQDGSQMLISVRKQVQNVRWAVFQCQLRILTQTHNLQKA